MEQPVLSVVCVVYNHEKYLRQALDGVLMQEVDFPYEVLVGEDCSTDGSRAILQEYAEKYPGVFTMFYREKNLGAKENGWDLYMRTRGEFMIVLECDDYWTDAHKLQRQVDYLRAHPEVISVAHPVRVVDENGNPTGERYPDCKKKHYTLKEYRRGLLPGQTASVMKRNYYTRDLFDRTLLEDATLFPGDRVCTFLEISHGQIHCLREEMSAYRHTFTGSSFSASVHSMDKRKVVMANVAFYEKLLAYAREHIQKEEIVLASEQIWFYYVLCARLRGAVDGNTLAQAWKTLTHPVRTALFCLKQLASGVLRKLLQKSGLKR